MSSDEGYCTSVPRRKKDVSQVSNDYTTLRRLYRVLRKSRLQDGTVAERLQLFLSGSELRLPQAKKAELQACRQADLIEKLKA